MSTDLPYMPAVGNVPAMLDKIKGAGTPPKFTVEFVKSTLGFASSQDRTFPRILKQLRFLTADGTPLPRYNEFKAATGGKAMADGLREGWAPVFLANQNAQNLAHGDLVDIFKTVTGESESVAKKMASTFRSLADKADWTAASQASTAGERPVDAADEAGSPTWTAPGSDRSSTRPGAGTLSLHHDIHLHLPPTSDVAVYRAIFRALREELQ